MTSRNTVGFFTMTMLLHTVLSVQKYFMKNITSAIPQPPYCHDISLSNRDVLLFPKLKVSLKGC